MRSLFQQNRDENHTIFTPMKQQKNNKKLFKYTYYYLFVDLCLEKYETTDFSDIYVLIFKVLGTFGSFRVELS